MESITKLLISKREKRKIPKYEWQELAMTILKEIPDSYIVSKASIFKVCKGNQTAARNAFNDCKELNKKYIKYFLKVYNALNKL